MIRFQHAIPAAVILAIGIWVAIISYTQQPAAAFVFPRLISTLFVIFAAWTLLRTVLGDSENAEGLNPRELLNMLPGVVVSAIYVFWGAKFFGFYTGTAIAVFTLITLYDPAPHSAVMSWIKRILITAGFMAVMYLLFAIILNVWTPREIFS